MGFDPRMLASLMKFSKRTTSCRSPSWKTGDGGRPTQFIERGSGLTCLKRFPTSTITATSTAWSQAPDVWRYFVRVKPDVLDTFISRQGSGA